ncbi:MAG: ROK family protein, partial [Bacteroidia bacterium]
KPEDFAAEIAAVVTKLLTQTHSSLRAVGIGAPNGNVHTGCIEFAPNMPWKGKIPLADWMQTLLQVPTILTNDANAAAVGEKLFGAAKNLTDFILVTLGTGVGSGFVVNGELVYGADGMAGELGHVVIERNGRMCGCGRAGCLETYTSATGVVRTVHEVLEAYSEPSLLRTWASTREIKSSDVTEAALQGDLMARDILDDTAEKLGFALANAVAITSPSHIFLFGGLAKAGDLLMLPLRGYFESFLLPIYQNKIVLTQSALPDDAAVLGAAALAWTQNEFTV